MDILENIISRMTKEEVRFFKIYSTRIINEEQRKDLFLFDKIRSQKEDFNERVFARKLYGSKANNYYRLKHRLFQNLTDFTALHNFDKSKINALNREWLVFNIHLSKNDFEAALYYLRNAEKKAVEIEQWEMLSLIYNCFIRLSSESLEINPEEYIRKQKENDGRLQFIQNMEQSIATLRYRLRVTQNFGRKDSVTASSLNKTIKEFTSSPSAKNNASFQTMIYKAVSQVLLQSQRYTELAEYLLSTYSEFIAKKWFNKENHDVKLQMLTYLANSLHRIGKHEESIFYAKQLGEDINSYNRVFYDRFVFFYYNTMVLNYLKSDMERALAMVEKMEDEMKQRKISYYDQFIYVNKAIALHWLGKPETAIRNLLKLYLLDSFKKADPSFRFKIMMMELIMQVDSNDPLSFSHRSKALKKDFKELLEMKDFVREHRLLEIMEVMIENKELSKDETLMKKVKKFIRDYGKEENDDYGIINYAQWMELRVLG